MKHIDELITFICLSFNFQVRGFLTRYCYEGGDLIYCDYMEINLILNPFYKFLNPSEIQIPVFNETPVRYYSDNEL